MEMEVDRNVYTPYLAESPALSGWWFSDKRKHSLELRLLKKVSELKNQIRYTQSTLDDKTLGRHNRSMRDLSVLTRFLKSKNIIEYASLHTSRINDVPAFFTCNVKQHYEPSSTDGYKKPVPLGNGFGKDPAIALSQAFGECLERYALSLYRNKNLLYGTCEDIAKRGTDFVHPSAIAGLSREQHQRLGHGEIDSSYFGWTYALHLRTGKKTLLPAQVVHWNYRRAEGEPSIKDITTNGAGGWFTREGAMLSGLFELIQRDAFMIYWFNKIRPPQIDPETVPVSDFTKLYEETKRYRFNVYCLNLTIDTQVPTFGVVLADNTGIYPSQVLGLSTNTNPLKALHRALEEAWSLYYWMRTYGSSTLMPINTTPFTDRTIDQRKRASLFGTPENKKYYEFLFEGKKQSFTEIVWPTYPINEQEKLNAIVTHLATLGENDYETYVYIPDIPMLQEIGYHTAQVIVPALVPIHINEPLPHLGSYRLKTTPPKLGYETAQTWNVIPQPFP